MNKKYKDCYIEYKSGIRTIGNSKIARKIRFVNNIPVAMSLCCGERVWQGSEIALFNVAEFNYTKAEVTFDFLLILSVKIPMKHCLFRCCTNPTKHR